MQQEAIRMQEENEFLRKNYEQYKQVLQEIKELCKEYFDDNWSKLAIRLDTIETKISEVLNE